MLYKLHAIGISYCLFFLFGSGKSHNLGTRLKIFFSSSFHPAALRSLSIFVKAFRTAVSVVWQLLRFFLKRKKKTCKELWLECNGNTWDAQTGDYQSFRKYGLLKRLHEVLHCGLLLWMTMLQFNWKMSLTLKRHWFFFFYLVQVCDWQKPAVVYFDTRRMEVEVRFIYRTASWLFLSVRGTLWDFCQSLVAAKNKNDGSVFQVWDSLHRLTFNTIHTSDIILLTLLLVCGTVKIIRRHINDMSIFSNRTLSHTHKWEKSLMRETMWSPR